MSETNASQLAEQDSYRVKEENGPELTLSSSSSTLASPRRPHLSFRVPLSPHTPPTNTFVTFDAISSQQSQPTSTARQDVHLLKPSASSNPVQRSYAPSTLETPVSSSSHHHQHAVTKPSPRLRTTIFQSSKDLAAHYGIPQFLPPAPRITPRTTTSKPVQQGHQNQFPDFDQIKNSYLAMLSTKPEEAPAASTAATDSAAPAAAAAAAAQQSMAPPPAPTGVNDKEFQELLSIIESPEFKDSLNQFTPSMDMDSYLTSPLPLLGHDFDESPRETPLNDFLSTPLFDTIESSGSVYSSPLFQDAHDFDMHGLMEYQSMGMFEPAKVQHVPPTSMPFDLDTLIPFTSPEQPTESDFSVPPTPVTVASSTFPLPETEARRRGGATGTRKGITPDSLIPLDAPTQPRKYTTPSATSRKELPAVFARKRSRSVAFNEEQAEEDDELARHEASPPGPNATEREQIEWKRRQNTLAARKSRKRKLEHQQALEESVRSLTRERDCWRTRAGVLQSLLVSHGVPFEKWEDE